MNLVSKSQASSSLIQNIERNKSTLDFTIFNIIDYSISFQILYPKSLNKGMNKRKLLLIQMEFVHEIFTKRRRTTHKISV